MTDEMMSLQALLEKSSDTDLLREVGFAAQRLMKLEVESQSPQKHGLDHKTAVIWISRRATRV